MTLFPSEVEGLIISRIAYLVALSDDTGEIVMANDNCTRLYGYLPGELVGKSVDDLVAPELKAVHREHRIRFNRNPVERAMGERMILQGRRKDGTTFTVRIQLIPCVIRGTAVTVAKVYPMSDDAALAESGTWNKPAAWQKADGS